MGRSGLLLFALALLSPYSSAQDGLSFDEAARAVRVHVESLADWCAENGLRRERYYLAEVLLGFSPEDEKLREIAGYRRVGETDWARPSRHSAPRKTVVDLLPQYRERLSSMESAVVSLCRAIQGAGRSLPFARRHRIVSPLSRLYPRLKALREANGEERRDARWRLVESRRSKSRARRMKQSALLLLDGMGRPSEEELTPSEEGLPLELGPARALKGVRVVGTVHRSELVAATRLAAATVKIFTLTFGAGISTWDGFTIVLLEGAAERDAFLDSYPGIDRGLRRAAEGLSSLWVPDTAVVGIWAPLREQRTEFVTRQVLSMLFLKTFGVSTRHGALHEGLGLLLGYQLTGQRGTWFIRRSRYDSGDTMRAIQEASGSWIDLVAKQRKKRPANYRSLLSKDVNTMEPADVLEAWAFASWLLHARPKEAEDFLRAVGGGMTFEQASQRFWGRSLPDLEQHVGRWIEEIR